MRRLLYIVYDFPPVGGGRVQRAVRFVRHLPHCGWEPVVLTPRHPTGPQYDPALQRQMEGRCRIVRTRSLEWRWARRVWHRAAETSTSVRGGRPSWWLRILRRLRWWLCTPDSRVGWVLFCVAAGRRLIQTERIDAIIATGSPYSSFLAAALLKRLTGVPLVLDFRDDWVTYNDHYFADKGRAILALERRMERWVIRQADGVITVTERLVESFRRRYPEQAAKFHCITNGFDPEAAVEPGTPQRNGRCRITYAGALYPHRTPRFFLEALHQCLQQRPELSGALEFVVAGEVDPAVRPLLEHFPHPDVVRWQGFLPHAQTLALLRHSDVLLVMEDQTAAADTILPGKIFEYLQAERPLLILANRGTIQETLARLRAGVIVSSTDVSGIRTALETLVAQHQAGTLRTELDRHDLQAFSAAELSRRLAQEVLEPLCRDRDRA